MRIDILTRSPRHITVPPSATSHALMITSEKKSGEEGRRGDEEFDDILSAEQDIFWPAKMGEGDLGGNAPIDRSSTVVEHHEEPSIALHPNLVATVQLQVGPH